MTTLKRIVLVGVAGAYNMAAIARSFIHKLIPDVDVLVLMPCEVDDLLKIIDPDTDMVVSCAGRPPPPIWLHSPAGCKPIKPL